MYEIIPVPLDDRVVLCYNTQSREVQSIIVRSETSVRPRTDVWYDAEKERLYMIRNEMMMEHHGVEPDCFRRGKLRIHAEKNDELKGITEIYMKALKENGAWDLDTKNLDKSKVRIVNFKYNGTIAFMHAISKLRFPARYTVSTEWDIG